MDALHIAVPGRKLLLLIGVLLLVRGTVFRRVTAFAAVPVPPRSWSLAVVPAHEEGAADAAHEKQALFLATRRSLLMSVITTTTVCWLPSPSLSIAAAKNENDILITLSQPGSPLGLELVDVTIGTPARSVAAIKTITGDTRQLQLLQPGMILPDFDSALAVQRRLQTGPYPVTLTFRNLAAGGDAYADDGKPLVTANDALQLAQKTSSTSTTTAAPYQVTQLQSVSNCPIRSRRNDVLEIQYTARYGSAVTSPNIVYDSSQQRGTGQPYQMVLGSGDMIPGVDQALYDMCPGEVRQVQIPPRLGYGPRARTTYRIPDGATLYWNIELVSVNSVRQGSDTTSREELEGRVPYNSALR